MNLCPCESKKSYSDCCEPFIKGGKSAPTAEALMRARYTAYAKRSIDYIERTHAPEARHDFDRKAATAWSENTEWLGLEIRETENGGPQDESGSVEFIARFKTKIPGQANQELLHHERSVFRKEAGEWFYVDGKTVRTPFTRAEPKLGRNDPCSCGSGKKFKKCCADV